MWCWTAVSISFHPGTSSCWQLWKGDTLWARKWVQMTGRAAERNGQVHFSEIILFQLASHFKFFNKCPLHGAPPSLLGSCTFCKWGYWFLSYTASKYSHVWLHICVTPWVSNGLISKWRGNKIQSQVYSSSLEKQIYCLQWKAVSNYPAILILAYIAPLSGRKWAVVIKGS